MQKGGVTSATFLSLISQNLSVTASHLLLYIYFGNLSRSGISISHSPLEVSAYLFLIRSHSFFFFLERFYLFILERGRERIREGNINVWLPLTRSLLGTWPTIPACALTGNRTSDPVVCRWALSPWSHTSQG